MRLSAVNVLTLWKPGGVGGILAPWAAPGFGLITLSHVSGGLLTASRPMHLFARLISARLALLYVGIGYLFALFAGKPLQASFCRWFQANVQGSHASGVTDA